MVEAGTDCCAKNFGAKFRHVVESEKSGRLNGAVDEDLFLRSGWVLRQSISGWMIRSSPPMLPRKSKVKRLTLWWGMRFLICSTTSCIWLGHSSWQAV